MLEYTYLLWSKKTKSIFWRTYEKLPEDLKEAIFSETNNEAEKQSVLILFKRRPNFSCCKIRW
jgi:hypothetical protein